MKERDLLVKLEEGPVTHRGVSFEAFPLTQPGWAVFGGSEGDSPTLRAFVDDPTLADALLNAYVRDGEDLVPAVFDGCKAPAFRLSDGRILVANDYRDRKAIAALADLTGADPKAWEKG